MIYLEPPDNPVKLVHDHTLTANTVMTQTSQPVPASEQRDLIKQIFLEHGFTVKDGQTDLKPYVYEAAEALLAAVGQQGVAQAPVQQKTESWLAYVDPECTSEQDKALHTVSGFRAGKAYNALCNMLKGHRFPDSFIENEAPAAHEFFMALFGVDAAPAATVQPVAWPLGFNVRHVDGHGWIIEPPYGSRWVAFDGTPAGDFMHAMTAAPQSQSTQAAKTELDDPLTLWRAIAEEAGAVVQSGVKYLMLTEEMCVRLGSALEALPRPSEAEISKKALDAILWMYRRLKPTTGELQFIEDAIRVLSHQPAQADTQEGANP